MCCTAAAARFLQPVLAKVISTLRAPKSSEGYRRIGGGSPLRRITEQQAAALGEALRARGLDARVYVGMRYWSPFIDDAVEQVCARARGGVLHLVSAISMHGLVWTQAGLLDW
jgi:ferrochelatase